MKRLIPIVLAGAMLATPAAAQTRCAPITPQGAAGTVPVIHYKPHRSTG